MHVTMFDFSYISIMCTFRYLFGHIPIEFVNRCAIITHRYIISYRSIFYPYFQILSRIPKIFKLLFNCNQADYFNKS